MKTGSLIRDLRTRKGLTQEELSAKTEISVRTIQRIESGEVDPRAYTLQVIAAALDVEFEVLAASESTSDAASSRESKKWLPLLHLSGLLLLTFPPIILWIWKREDIGTIRQHAMNIINFQLSMTLYLIPCLLFSIYPILVVLIVYSQVIIIINTVKVATDQPYKYHLSIRFLKPDAGASQAELT